MIDCPICGAKTTVTETRRTGTSARRRRRCSIASCAGKVTTIELVVKAARGSAELAEGNVLVPKKQIEKLKKIVATITGENP